MKSVETARERIARATDLCEVLDASYRAFATMLRVIQQEQDQGGPLFAAFMMAGTPADAGRLALLDAPSLPASTRLTPFPHAADLTPSAERACSAERAGSSEHAAAAVAWLSLILACRLDDQAASADNAEDREACVEAARHAWTLHARLS